MAGRLEKDSVQTDGFTSLDDTEIPQLQEHAKKLTKGSRISTSQLFLNELNRLLNSMSFWAADGTRPAVIQKELKVDEKVLQDFFTKLDTVGYVMSLFALWFANISFQNLREAVEDCRSSMKHDLEKHLYKTFDTLIPIASGSALETAT